MSQVRVTDYFSQRKKGTAAPVKAAKRCNPRSGSSQHKDPLRPRLSSVHREFVRVIDEATEGGPVEKTSAAVDKDSPACPRTPKRDSREVEQQLPGGSASSSATADHSAAKKRRQAGEPAAPTTAAATEKLPKKRARRKIVLPKDSVQELKETRGQEEAATETRLTEETQPPAEERVTAGDSGSPQSSQVISRRTRGRTSESLCKEDIAALKSRLQRIQQRWKESSDASVAVPTTPSPAPPTASAADDTRSRARKPTKAPVSEAKTLSATLARAKELAAKAQRRTEEKEAEESAQGDSGIQDSSELPAYQRYHTLAQAVPPGLALPYQYKVLAEMFRSMDTVVAMLHNRHETVTFSKVKQGVQDMMHKRFEESHVAQINAVFPDAYTFRQEKDVPTFNSSIKKGSYQLTVQPIIHTGQNESAAALSASKLLERRHIFHMNLVTMVKQHHKTFLSSVVPAMLVPEDKLTRWHPRFNVDTVPAIQGSALPQPPHTEKLATAQEVLDKARSLMTPKMEKALVSLASKTEDKAPESKAAASPPSSVTPATSSAAPLPAALKGVSQSLLDRIRAKEAQKLQAAMTRNPVQEDRLLMMSRLPELARILRTVFVAEKKPALIMEVACNRMIVSYRSALSTGEMEKHIRLLAEVAPDWLTIHPIRKDFYLKLQKMTELNAVVDKISSRLKEEEERS
ncbi:DNA replication factor Cdt1 [Nelusetta ayraudi]|uniref:DNA replication factor Cdt1 n=1 Tax=Nelusetta ayraudi TaxID=303726 RepID=UPI003F726A3E